jgi:hypothetical protein
MRSITHSMTALWMVVGFQGADTPKQPKPSDLVMVRGCLHGLTLTTSAAPDFDSAPRQFQLNASRELSGLLKQHTGHMEEITGVLKAGKDAGAARIKEKSGSKGRIYVGAGTTPSTLEIPTASVVDVRSVRHLENRCP